MFLTFDTVEAFAAKRNSTLSFPYLKENGELLSISANTGMMMEPRALSLYQDFYDKAPSLMACYPQYYRFILGMALDLETLGMQGDMGARLCQTVSQQEFVDFDTADSRRLETLTMLSTRQELTAHERQVKAMVIDNIDRFIAKPAHFTKFNKPFFYELTHFIFFLTDYGRAPMPNSVSPLDCLMNIGLLALLDHDADMLAEVCICLKYFGAEVPDYWHKTVIDAPSEIKINFNESVASALNPAVDEYHLSFVLNWYKALNNTPAFTEKFYGKTPSFECTIPTQTILSKISDYVHNQVVSNQKTGADFVDSLSNDELEKMRTILRSVPEGPALMDKLSNGLIHI